ncbi:MAG: nucleotidyl transferase AbiEii/AbiGii toxin family protein, partial [Bdellovibrionota bacterium]
MMSKKYNKEANIFPHENTDVFRDFIQFTAGQTGFPAHLVEKDYYCSLVLWHLFGHEGPAELVFKGGTALNKVYFGFYRLSEDIDLSIPVELDVTRGERRKKKTPVEMRIRTLTEVLPLLTLTSPWTGANNSTQYLAEISYPSVITSASGRIKIETAMREPMHSIVVQDANCLLLDPTTEALAFSAVKVRVIGLREAMAEKVRAVLTRRTPAIRDVFDLWHAHGRNALPLGDATFINLAKVKLAIPGNEVGTASATRLDAYRAQLETDLRPVLRPTDFERFDFDQAWKLV